MTKDLKPKINNPEPHHSELKNLLELYQNRQFDDAEQLALTLTDKFKNHPFGWKVLGALLNQAGRLSEGLAVCQKSVSLEPNNAEAHNNLGNTLHKLDRFDEADENYRKAIALKSDYAEAHNNLGNTLHKLDRFDEAEESYRKAIAFKSGYSEAYFNLGNILQELRRSEEAVKSYKKAIDLKPNYTLAYNNLGITLRELGRLKESENIYSKAIEIDPNFSEALLNRGALFFEKGEFELSLQDFDICNTKSSRARALSSLYALDRIQDIYKRIEMQPKEDEENLRIAAIAAFISERENKDISHNFCKNPLEFIHFSNIAFHLKENSDLFITELIKELHNVKTTWEPYNKATKKGFQSTDNLFENPLVKMSILKSMIIAELDSYYSKFQYESCSYIKKWPSEKHLHGWHVILKQHGNQQLHIHPSGWLSGVIYLKVVPTLDANEGAIEFGLSGKRYFHVDSPKVIYQPKFGDIVFFPSSLNHRTIPFTSDTDRIIVSFDLMPNAVK